MAGKRSIRRCLVAGFAGMIGAMVMGSCQSTMNSEHRTGPRRNINLVLADHDDQLLAIPGVVGVYVGLLDDESTPCLKVMMARKDRGLERSIPPVIEGYRVVTEVTGEIKPLGPGGRAE